MFKRVALPQRKKLSLDIKQVKKDIEAVWPYEEQRNMLYSCLEEKPMAEEYKVAKMEEFLTGSNNLESAQKTLKIMAEEIVILNKEIADAMDSINKRVENVKPASS